MKVSRNIIILGSLFCLMLIAAFISESLYFGDFEYKFRTRRFNRILAEKDKIMEDCLEAMKPILAREAHHGSITENNLFSIAEQNKITILEYIDRKLVYWSDNEFDVPMILNDSLYKGDLVFLQNGWFLPRSISAGNEIIVGLLRIRTDYNFENDIIRSGFEREYGIPGNVGFSRDSTRSVFHVSDRKGDFLFSLEFPEVKVKSGFIYFPMFFWVISFILMILVVLRLADALASTGNKIPAVLSVLLFFTLVYLLMLASEKPLVLFQTDLFSPYRFSSNTIIPSLGHMLVMSIMAAVFSSVFYRHFPMPAISKESFPARYSYLTLLLLPGAMLIVLYHSLFEQLLLTSNINFETFKILDISFFSVAGFTSAILLILVPVLYLLKVFQVTKGYKHVIILLSIATTMIIPGLFFYRVTATVIPLILFYLVLSLSICYSVRVNMALFNMAVVFSLVYGIYSLYFITILSDQKLTENLKVRAVSLSTENDPDAEDLLISLWPEISSDSVLTGMMQNEFFVKEDAERISRYIQESYMTGYLKNFNFTAIICRDDESLRVGPENELYENCFDFFEQRVRMNGHRLTGTDFYFIDNQGGRSYYLGRISFRTGGGNINGLFIELYSDINVFQPGYPELLLDRRNSGFFVMRDFSVGKYINGELVLSTGDFAYSKADAGYFEKETDYRIFSTGGYKHVLYRNGNTTIILSRPELGFGDLAISFAYIFAYILVFMNFFIMMIRRPMVKKPNVLNFRQKLQFSYIGILLFSFLLIGIVVVYLTINQFHEKHYENIREKLNSVYLELDLRLASDKSFETDLRNKNNIMLNELLIRLSNAFNTDINLYDLNGLLVASSRPEIFNRNLTSRRIDNMAYINLADLTRSEYLQKERIGSLEYISAYVPFQGSDKKVLAYLNLPYFRMQSILAKEISNLVVAVINFTLLLIVITMSLAVFISGLLTSPLSMLGEGLASVGVGKKSEHLVYRGSDEIGELVKQYNRMVDEIEESAQKLANSEREYAWREMAKQIAHEIKNPLTPMKLNVQQLFKSWNDKAPEFDKLLERFTRNQIEYIDNLSSIATAFSSFAKMPGNNPSEINLLDQIRSTLELFNNTANISFSVQWPKENRVMIYADREHLNGAFSNLIKNGIQSIPAGKNGRINIAVEVKGDKVIIAVSDNGEGIPPELQRKLFTPNFTTKSSGMGLGLSIAKRYIENAGGRIWFESVSGEGSVFYIELPLLYTVEQMRS